MDRGWNLFAVLVLLAAIRTPSQGVLWLQTDRSSTPAQAYERALYLLERGEAREALREVDAALARDPNNVSLYNLKGLAASQAGDFREAEASFRKVTELSPHSALGYNNLATLFFQTQRFPDAARLFREALTRDPDNFTALLGLGTTLAKTQGYVAASPFLKRAWTGHPADFRTAYEWALALHEMKKPTEAQRVLEGVKLPEGPELLEKYFTLSGVLAKVLGDEQTALQSYRRAYEQGTHSFRAYLALVRESVAGGAPGQREALPAAPKILSAEQHFMLGVLFASHDFFQEAIPHLEAAFHEEPQSTSAAYNLAVAYKGAGRLQDAINCLEQSLREKPDAELFDLLASLEESSGKFVDALNHFRKAVELDPSTEQYYFDLGTEYLVHFTFGPALDVFGAGSRNFPESARQHVGMGLALYALRKYKEAAEAFLSALEMDPSSRVSFSAWNSLPAFIASDALQDLMPRLARLAEQHPRSAQALYCYGAALFQSALAEGNSTPIPTAEGLLQRAITLRANFVEAYLELGSLDESQGKKDKAVANYLKAIELDPASELAHYRLGQLYRDQNRLEEAREKLAEYVRLSRERHQEMARTRSAVKQFILAEQNKTVPIKRGNSDDGHH